MRDGVLHQLHQPHLAGFEDEDGLARSRTFGELSRVAWRKRENEASLTAALLPDRCSRFGSFAPCKAPVKQQVVDYL
jgi:hypothetical protein